MTSRPEGLEHFDRRAITAQQISMTTSWWLAGIKLAEVAGDCLVVWEAIAKTVGMGGVDLP